MLGTHHQPPPGSRAFLSPPEGVLSPSIVTRSLAWPTRTHFLSVDLPPPGISRPWNHPHAASLLGMVFSQLVHIVACVRASFLLEADLSPL